ncbi:MAG: hypothetical protein M1833_000120 [Piccolia ochrophora]|nr:MAG: hypothetical protein M1833_000120 [Piccolia ochrophora]
MAPSTTTATTTLSYPLFAADFDPFDDSYLLVGGGGGEGRSGIPNKITLLDTASRYDISNVADIDLPRSEDSVMSLAVAQRTDDDSSLAYAGVNASTEDQKADKNEHMRSFTVHYPPPRRRGNLALDSGTENGAEKLEREKPGSEGKGDIKQIQRASLFVPSKDAKKETYQRVTRLSPVRYRETRTRLGAIATGLAKASEIVVFKSNNGPHRPIKIDGRIPLSKGEEAGDVDIIDQDKGQYQLAYCTDYEIYTCKYGTGNPTGSKPVCVYVSPHPDVFSDGLARFKLRSLRFLTPSLIAILANTKNQTGVELLVLKTENGVMGEIVRRKKLPRSMKAAIGLDVAVLLDSQHSRQQFVFAVAGKDVSLALYTLDYAPGKGLTRFRHYTTIRDAHPLQMTKICFSTFIAPSEPARTPQYLKLASVSMGNTVAVHTFPLIPHPPSSRKPHYVLATPSQASKLTIVALLSAILVVITAIAYQSLLEIRGGSRPYLHAADYLPPKIRSWIERPYALDLGIGPFAPSSTSTLPSSSPSSSTDEPSSTTRLRHLLSQRPPPRTSSFDEDDDEDVDTDTIVVYHSPDHQGTLHASLHNPEDISSSSTTDDEQSDARSNDDNGATTSQEKNPSPPPHGTKWEDLSHPQRHLWRQRLIDAGEWALDEGEAVLKGVVFGEMAGVVGDAVRGG